MSFEEFGKCLDVPFEGQTIQKLFVQEWQGYSKVNYYFIISRLTQQDILSKKNPASSRLILYGKNLFVSDRILYFIIAYILMPENSNHFQIGDFEMQLIYDIKQWIKVNWGYSIMFHMQHQQGLRGGLPYARLITKILEFCGVDLKREPKKRMNPKECEINVRATIRDTLII
jgi:hypothetical protein